MDNILYHRMFPNFQPQEFRCPCEHPLCQGDGMEFWFLSALQDLRLQVGFPLKINSGYRCSIYNEHVGGVKNSYHVKGVAVDICTRAFSPKEKHRLLRKAFQRFTGIGMYTTFIHLDLRPLACKSVWVS